MIKVATPALGTALLWQIGYMVLLLVLTVTLSRGSVTALAGLTAGLRIEALLFLPAAAFNMTASVLVGHALGQGNAEEARRLMLYILGVACAVMSLVGLCMWPWRAELAALLAPDPVVQAEIVAYLGFNILSVPFTVPVWYWLACSAEPEPPSIPCLLTVSASGWCDCLWLGGWGMWSGKARTAFICSWLVSQIFQSSSLLWVALRCNWTRFAWIGSHTQPHSIPARRVP